MTHKKILLKGLFFLILSTGLVSCSTYKHIAYFQDIPTEDSTVYKKGVTREEAQYKPLKIESGDILQVTVQTKMPEITQDLGIPTIKGFRASDWLKAGPLGQGSSSSSQNVIPGYKVDKKGKIELPLMGKIAVNGLTVPEIKKKVDERAAHFYKNPVVNVRLANFRVTVLGEVGSPGTYILDQEKSTLLDALGMAGDMTIYGRRMNVMLIRDVDGKKKMVRFNMNSTDIFNSTYFYLRPGDVVYVEPTKGRALASDEPKLRFYSMFISTASILVAILTRVL